MKPKLHSHKVSLNDRRRDKKMTHDTLNKSGEVKQVRQMFDTYYKDQVRALYRAVAKDN